MSFPTARKLFSAALLIGGIGSASSAQALDSPWLSRILLKSIPVQKITGQTLAPPNQAPANALDYAHSLETHISSDNKGRWSFEQDRAVWRIKLHSSGAQNLSITLADLQLAASAQLRLYDAQGELWHGPINADTLTQREQFWSPIVPGEHLLLELSQARDEARSALRVSHVHHGTTAWDNTAKSGSCNIDTACPAADAWTNAIRASARITIGGRRLCSAVLLNNTLQDGTPLLLTAKHCGIGESADMSAGSVVVYWNYETSRCGGNPDGNLRQQQSGSTLLADGDNADFSLIRLDARPRPQYGVYYAGWDARFLSPSSGVSVHHPSGDEKRISLFQRSARARSANVDGNTVASWEVNWDQGITEAGSSGAGLWNNQQRVVGQLSGGNSSCANPNASDVFGRLDAAWQASSAPSGQLRAWLDAGQTGQRFIDGLDSRDSTTKATTDQFLAIPQDSQTLRLDVLTNDFGTPPLRLLSAQAQNGEVQLSGQQLIYQFSPENDSDTVEYQLIDRWGATASGNVQLDKAGKNTANTSTRGGSLGMLMLVFLLPLLTRCRSFSRP